MNYTLIIIDMQDCFRAALYKKTQHNCLMQIKQAIKDKAPIIFVEYNHCGETLPSLIKFVKDVGYTKVHRIIKKSNDGSQVINRLLKSKKHNLPRTHLRVCGVNTDCCVLETVLGLDKILSKDKHLIEVVDKACASTYSHQEGIDDMLSLSSHITVI